MGAGPISAGGLIGVAEGVAEVQQTANAGIVLVSGHQRRLHPQAAGDQVRPVGGLTLQLVQNGGIPDHAVFDDLRHTAAPLALRQGGKAIGIHQHHTGLVNASQQVFALRQIHRRFAAHGTVHLCQQRSGQVNQHHAPLITGGSKARQIAGDAAAQSQQAVGPGEVLSGQLAAQGKAGLGRLVRFTCREGQQLAGQSGSTEAVQHRAAIQRRHRVVRRHRPAAAGKRGQQRARLRQHAAADMNGIAALRQRDGNDHGTPPTGGFSPFYRTFRRL